MGAPKTKTLIERLGFDGKEIKEKSHDAIIKWIETCAEYLLPKWVGFSSEWQFEDFSVHNVPKSYSNPVKVDEKALFQSLPKPPKPMPKIVYAKWQHLVRKSSGGSNSFAGFVDLRITYAVPSLSYDFETKTARISEAEKRYAYFEAKTALPTLGELFRQIRLYKEYEQQEGRWFVVAPEANEEDVAIMRKQGVTFIKYEPELLEEDECEAPDGTIYRIPPKLYSLE